MKKIKLENGEKKMYKWIFKNRYRIITIFVLMFIFLSISRLPYLNLFFTSDISFPILLVIAIFLFNININSILKLGLGLFVLAFLFEVLDKSSSAEFMANCIYVLFLTSVIKGILKIKEI